MLLEVADVSKYFDGLVALSDTSFGVNEKEMVGLIGPNESGKARYSGG